MPGWEVENGWHLVGTINQTSTMGDWPGVAAYPPYGLGPWPPGYARWALKWVSGDTVCVGLNMYLGDGTPGHPQTYLGESGGLCSSAVNHWAERSQSYPTGDSMYAHLELGRTCVAELWAGNTVLPPDTGTGVAATPATLEGIAATSDHLHEHIHLILASVRKDY